MTRRRHSSSWISRCLWRHVNSITKNKQIIAHWPERTVAHHGHYSASTITSRSTILLESELEQHSIEHTLCASDCVVECRTCNREVLTGWNLGLGYYSFAPISTQPSILPGSVNEYQLRLGRQRRKYGSFRLRMKRRMCFDNACYTWAP